MNKATYTSPAIRRQLLSTVSALMLLGYSWGTGPAWAADSDRPQLWIELGGELDRTTNQGELFAPDFIAANAASPVLQSVTPIQAQKPPTFGFDEDGRISFQPKDSDWLFSASIRYGRSTSSRHVHHQTQKEFVEKYVNGSRFPYSSVHFTANFADTYTKRRDSNTILDFSAGKDVGLGLFGSQGSSNLALDIRFAQFSSKANFNIRARPDLGFKYSTFAYYHIMLKFPHMHNYLASGQASREFRGVGPSLSWNGSAAIAGNEKDSEIALDWGLNAGVLFGRQKAHVRHHETGYYRSPLAGFHPSNLYTVVYKNPPRGHDTDRSVAIPNIGGFAALSFRYAAAKVSFGYRADLFFGAMDTGIDAAKKSNVLFHGPYASISVGLGD